MLMKAPVIRRRGAPVRSMLTISSAVLGATLVVAGTAGGTYGLWADSAPIGAGIVESGSLTLLVNNASSTTISSSSWSAMFPGDRVQQSVTLTNNGNVASDVTVSTASTATFSGDYTVEVTQGACPANSANLNAPNALQAVAPVGIWNTGQSRAACIEVTLLNSASNASRGTTLPLTLTFTATQRVS